MNPNSLPTQDEIAQRAHSLWLARGSPAGSAMEDWLAAERALRRERQRGAAATDEIDEDKLAERLDDFSEPDRRSITSADLP
ncbi:MAG TPA: DUF2934 domain-containing protein [Opitutus sp.]|nr:DUF2934 domain-containing protein [Opitutus sp.]